MRLAPLAATVLLVLGGGVLPGLASKASAASEETGSAAPVKKESPLACNRAALTPAQRTRHFDELGPKLRAIRKGVRELADGYEFQFSSDASTYSLLTDWAAGERVCCPFFDVDVQSTREGGPLLLRLTGRDGVKQFIEIDAAAWLKQ